MNVEKNLPPDAYDVQEFLKRTDLKLPIGFIDFFIESNGADIQTEEKFILLWPLTEMIKLNEDYEVEIYAPDYFIFGSDGGDMAFALHKKDGNIYELPFIGMSNDEATFIASSFIDFIKNID